MILHRAIACKPTCNMAIPYCTVMTDDVTALAEVLDSMLHVSECMSDRRLLHWSCRRRQANREH